MGFFSNAKTIFVASGKTLANSADLMAEGALKLERASNRFVLETNIKTLELRRKRIGDDWFSPENASENERLAQAYLELLRDMTPGEKPAIREGMERLASDHQAFKVREKLRAIEAQTSRFDASPSNLAIDEILLRRQVISDLDDLTDLAGAGSNVSTQAADRKRRLMSEISELQPARRTVHTTYYESGAQESKAVRWDGELTENYEEWHENGTIRWRIPFKRGRPIGSAERYRPNGVLGYSASIENGFVAVTAFADSAEPLARVERRQKLQKIELLPEQLNAIRVEGRPGTRSFKWWAAFKLLTSQRAIRFIWRARLPGKEQELWKEVTQSADELEGVLRELGSILDSSHVERKIVSSRGRALDD